MKLIYIADSVVPSRAANSIQVMKMCAAFARAGHEVELIVRHLPDRELPVEPFSFYGLQPTFTMTKLSTRWGGSSKAAFAWRAARAAAGRRPDLVYSRSLAACYFCSHRGIRVVYESHTPERGMKGPRVYPLLLRRSQMLRHVVVSQALRDYYLKERNAPESIVKVVPNGYDVVAEGEVDKVQAGADAGTRRRIRTRPPGKGRVQIGYIGHLYRGRGVGLILELARRVPEADFHFVGGTEADIAHWSRTTGESGNVFFHGFCPPAEVEHFQRQFDILVAPYGRSVSVDGGSGLDSVRWMSPLKIFEYLASGKPIVASRLRAIEEIVEDGRSAVLCTPESADEWEATLRRLVADPEARDAIGREGLRMLRQRYTLDHRVRQVLEGLHT